MKDRYIRNGISISPEETTFLATKKVFIAGCGGLGGYILEMILRVGIGSIVVADPDVFDESNLNRQLLSNEDVLGVSKVQIAGQRAGQVNSLVQVTTHSERITAENAGYLMADANIIMDALDSFSDRLVLERAAEELGIPLVHGAVAGWYGQVSTVYPGDQTIRAIYRDRGEGVEKELGTPSFTPAVIAGIQVSEALKVLLGKGDILRNKLLYLDLLNHSYSILDFKEG